MGEIMSGDTGTKFEEFVVVQRHDQRFKLGCPCCCVESVKTGLPRGLVLRAGVEEDGEKDGGDVVEVLCLVPDVQAAVDTDGSRPVVVTAGLEVRSDLEGEGLHQLGRAWRRRTCEESDETSESCQGDGGALVVQAAH